MWYGCNSNIVQVGLVSSFRCKIITAIKSDVIIGNLPRGIQQRSQIICSQKGNCRCYKCPKDNEALRHWMPPKCVAQMALKVTWKEYSEAVLSDVRFYPRCINMKPNPLRFTGPSSDHYGRGGGYFLLVDSNHEIKDPPMTTELYSPNLAGPQHPKECIMFWFQMPVTL